MYSFPDFPDLIPYQITDEPDLEGLTPEAADFLEEIHPHLQQASVALIAALKSHIELFPDIAIFKSHLMVVYASQGKLRAAQKMGELIREKHPDYLFARINLASLNSGRQNGAYVREQLGQELWLHKLLPDEVFFHESEVRAYYNVVVRQLLKEENWKEAIQRHKVMVITCPNAEETKKLAILLVLERRKDSQEQGIAYQEEEEEENFFEEYYLAAMLDYLNPGQEGFFEPAEGIPAFEIPNRSNSVRSTLRSSQPKVNRNAPCPCGSGKKFKHCCMRKY